MYTLHVEIIRLFGSWFLAFFFPDKCCQIAFQTVDQFTLPLQEHEKYSVKTVVNTRLSNHLHFCQYLGEEEQPISFKYKSIMVQLSAEHLECADGEAW